MGLPLSNTKLNLSAFAPLISKVDRRLSSWQAVLLNHQGRLTLINSVIDGLINYSMQALALPPGIIATIDSRRRAFLWSGTDKTNGSKCLVSWEGALLSKKEGGLGVRDLAAQNACLLLKLLHRLYHPEQSAWAAWAVQHTNIVTLEGARDGNHWEGLKELLPAYRSITRIHVGDGNTTSFWWDVWSGNSSMATKFPCLLSHCNDTSASLSQVVQLGILQFLVPRLSPQAACELVQVDQLLSATTLTQRPDNRTSIFASTHGNLNTARIYKITTSTGQTSRIYPFVWKSRAPPRVCFFGWLLLKERIQCRANLHRKNILDDDICELCRQNPETVDHLIFHCSVAAQFWNHVRCQGMPLPAIPELWNMPRPAAVPPQHFNTFLLLCCWNIWNHRHDVVFRQQNPCLRRLLTSCKQAARLWSCRLRPHERQIADVWCQIFTM